VRNTALIFPKNLSTLFSMILLSVFLFGAAPATLLYKPNGAFALCIDQQYRADQAPPLARFRKRPGSPSPSATECLYSIVVVSSTASRASHRDASAATDPKADPEILSASTCGFSMKNYNLPVMRPRWTDSMMPVTGLRVRPYGLPCPPDYVSDVYLPDNCSQMFVLTKLVC